MSSSRAFQGSRPSTVNFPWYEYKSKDCIERGGLAGAVRTDQSEDAALFDTKIDIIQRDGCAKNFAKTVCFYRCHDVTSPLALAARFARQQSSFFLGQPSRWIFSATLAILRQKLLTFALEQQIARTGSDEHAKTSLHLDQLLVDQLCDTLSERWRRIDPILGRDVPHRRQRIAFFEHAVENHMDATIAKLAINRLTIAPFTTHPCVSQWPLRSAARRSFSSRRSFCDG